MLISGAKWLLKKEKRIIMYQANVYRIMIASPSDIQEEIKVAVEVLNSWNNIHSEPNKMVLLPLHWSISSYPASGKHPQKLLDKQVVEKSDLLVCVFGAKLGTPTDTEISGTVEEIKEHRKAGKDVMMFFKKNVEDISSVDPIQLQKLKEFKESVKNEFLWADFTDTKDFKQQLNNKLQLYINDNWGSIVFGNNKENGLSIIESLSDFDIERLKNWTNGRSTRSYHHDFLGGRSVYNVGDVAYEVTTGRERAEWDEFYERLLSAGFVDFERYDSHGNPVYKLKKTAYDYVDGIKTEK